MIRYRIARCSPTNFDENGNAYKDISISVEHENFDEQVSHHIRLSGSQCLEKTNEECIDLSFKLMSGSISKTVTKLLDASGNIVGSYYIPS